MIDHIPPTSDLWGKQAHMVKTILFVKGATNGFAGHNSPKNFSFFLLKNLTLKRNNKAQTIINIKFPIYERSKQGNANW